MYFPKMFHESATCMCVGIIIVILVLDSPFVHGQHSNTAICPDVAYCKCKALDKYFLIYFCEAEDFEYDVLPNITFALPNNTRHLEFIAKVDVDLNNVDFSNLKELKVLRITSHAFDFAYREILPITRTNIFGHLTELEELHMNIKWGLQISVQGLFEPLVNLQILDLSDTQKLDIGTLIANLPGFANNTKLRVLNLWNFQELNNAPAQYLSLSLEELLRPLQHCPLEELNIGYNGLRDIGPGIIQYAPKLRKLIASHSFVYPLFTSSLFLDVILHPTLEEAFLGNIGTTYEGVNGVRRHRNRRSNNSYRAIGGEDRCKFLQDKYKPLVELMANNHAEFCNLLKREDPRLFGHIPCEVLPGVRDLVRKGCSNCVSLPVSRSLRRLHVQQLNQYDPVYHSTTSLSQTQCVGVNALEYLDLSHNRGAYGESLSVLGNSVIKGLFSLKVLNISATGMDRVNPGLTAEMPSLQHIDLADNSISLTQAGDERLFQNNTELRFISLALNRLKSIPHQLFSSQVNLQFLNLSHNQLDTFEVDVSKMINIQYIDLRNNQLRTMNNSVLGQLVDIAKRGEPITIDLRNNDFQCDCMSISFIDWIVDSQNNNIDIVDIDTLPCFDSNSNKQVIKYVDRTALYWKCNVAIVYIMVSIGSTLAVVLVLLFSYLIWRNRWKLRTWKLTMDRRFRQFKHHVEMTTSYDYDAFVCFSEYDRDWFYETFRPEMEEKRDFRLCYHERDFMPGMLIEDNILGAIERSRKTVLILSPNFVESQWCKFEMNMARQRLFSAGIDVLIPVLLKPISRTKLPKNIKGLLDSKSYIQWSEDKDRTEYFWARIEEAIGRQA